MFSKADMILRLSGEFSGAASHKNTVRFILGVDHRNGTVRFELGTGFVHIAATVVPGAASYIRTIGCVLWLIMELGP